jgi:RNA recognition motif-containing protein
VKNLFVGNLGSEVTHEELRRLFEAYGQVVQVHIIVDRDTGLPRGFAFVEMTNDAEAEKAIRALNGSISAFPTYTSRRTRGISRRAHFYKRLPNESSRSRCRLGYSPNPSCRGQ